MGDDDQVLPISFDDSSVPEPSAGESPVTKMCDVSLGSRSIVNTSEAGTAVPTMAHVAPASVDRSTWIVATPLARWVARATIVVPVGSTAKSSNVSVAAVCEEPRVDTQPQPSADRLISDCTST